jgi:hypothetical protein
MLRAALTKKDIRSYAYWMVTWREDGKVRNVYQGSCKKKGAEAALQKTRAIKGRVPGDQDLNSKDYQVISMCELLERKDRRHATPYDKEEPEDITKSLMILSERSLHDFLASEPDIYTVDDLKVRYR